MKKTLSIIIAAVLTLSLISACALIPPDPSSKPMESPSGQGEIKLATLKGPTTMGLVKLLDDAKTDNSDYKLNNTIYGTADEISALLIKGDIDMAAVPCNLASILYNKTEGAIQVAAVNTLGVLNVIELGENINSVADLKGKKIYSTGKGTTPEFVLNAILKANGIDPKTDVDIEYKTEATEIAGILTGENAVKDAIAVLPQPYATTVLLGNPDTRIALDLTKEWENAELNGKLITGVLVVRSEFAKQNAELMKTFLTDYSDSTKWVNDNTEAAAQLIFDAGIVPKTEIAVKALPYCNIVFETGDVMKTDVKSYLNVLFEQEPASVGGVMPDEEFYYSE